MTKYIPLILFTVLTNATAQILLKKWMLEHGSFEFDLSSILSNALQILLNPLVALGLLTFVISMASHLLVLSRVEISFAMPFLSLAYVVVAVYAYIVFNEDLNVYRIAGISFICFGTILSAKS